MKNWTCTDCGARKSTGDDRARGPLCSEGHHPLRMVDVDELGAETGPPPAAGDEIVWRDPPPAMARRRKADEQRLKFIAALQTRPGAWAVCPGTRKSVPSCSALAKKHPGTEWVARKIGPGQVELYGRWIGDANSAAA